MTTNVGAVELFLLTAVEVLPMCLPVIVRVMASRLNADVTQLSDLSRPPVYLPPLRATPGTGFWSDAKLWGISGATAVRPFARYDSKLTALLDKWRSRIGCKDSRESPHHPTLANQEHGAPKWGSRILPPIRTRPVFARRRRQGQEAADEVPLARIMGSFTFSWVFCPSSASFLLALVPPKFLR